MLCFFKAKQFFFHIFQRKKQDYITPYLPPPRARHWFQRYTRTSAVCQSVSEDIRKTVFNNCYL